MLKRIYSCLKIIYKYSPIAAFLYLVFSIIMAVLPAIILIITERLINSIAIGSAHIKTEIFLWILLLFLSLLFMAILTFINGIQKIKINKTLSIKFSLFFYKQITALEYSNFENADSQNTFSRLGNSLYERIVDMYEIFCATFSALLGFVAYAALFVQVSLWTLILFPIVAISIYIIDSKNLKIMKQLQDRQSLDERFASYLEKICLNKHALFELKVFGAAKYIIQLFSSKSKKLHKELYNEYTYLQRNLFIGALISILWIALIIYHLSDAIIKAEVSIGLFATLIGGAYSLVSSIQSFSYLSSVLTQESVVMVHYQNFFSFKRRHESECLTNTLGLIEFINVSFSYPNSDILVLKNLSFAIDMTKNTAIVGKNGSGKSTIIKLLLKLYSPISGQILINGQNIQNIRTEELHKVFAVAFQEFLQYSLTLEENLSLGEDLENEKLNKVVHSFFPDSDLDLDTVLGKFSKGGRDLSLGQWQRLVLARLFLSQSNYLIMDEPTASLDPIAESKFYTSMQGIIKEKGSLIISHRLASSKMADVVFVMDEGQILQQGSHDELIEKPGLYHEMWQYQSSWYLEDTL